MLTGDQIHALRELAADPDVRPEHRVALRRALAELGECRRHAYIVDAARLVAGFWADPKFQADAAMAYWDQLLRQQAEGGRRRASMMVALDDLRHAIRKADQQVNGKAGEQTTASGSAE